MNSTSAVPASRRHPLPTLIPELTTAELALRYEQARVGGDFFDCMRVGQRLIFALLDIAGERTGAMEVAASIQDVFRTTVPTAFCAATLNESHALVEVVVTVNRTVLRTTNGVRCTPGFIGCYNEDLQTIFFINAGAFPALLKDSSGVAELGATGLPLGLFSHATHEPDIRALQPGAALVMATRGVVEVLGPRREEFGIARLKEAIDADQQRSANALCTRVLVSVRKFAELRSASILGRWRSDDPFAINDRTVVALVRYG